MTNVKRTRFVSEPQETLKCILCTEVADDPLQHSGCGTLMCRNCLDGYGKERPCPKCKQKSEYYMDNKSKYGSVYRCDIFTITSHCPLSLGHVKSKLSSQDFYKIAYMYKDVTIVVDMLCFF
jgi:hypothetical protein